MFCVVSARGEEAKVLRAHLHTCRKTKQHSATCLVVSNDTQQSMILKWLLLYLAAPNPYLTVPNAVQKGTREQSSQEVWRLQQKEY
jgi:hypothetical protein